MEPWESLCPELPPGAGPLDRYGRTTWRRSAVSPTQAWLNFTEDTGMTRKAYAELIAPRLVREALKKSWHEDGEPGPFVSVHFWPDHVEIEASARDEHETWNGPDICTAAIACINALKGGGS